MEISLLVSLCSILCRELFFFLLFSLLNIMSWKTFWKYIFFFSSSQCNDVKDFMEISRISLHFHLRIKKTRYEKQIIYNLQVLSSLGSTLHSQHFLNNFVQVYKWRSNWRRRRRGKKGREGGCLRSSRHLIIIHPLTHPSIHPSSRDRCLLRP